MDSCELTNLFVSGTNERVCLISGPPEAVMTILEFVGDKIREKPDPNAKPAIDFDNKVQAEREKQVIHNPVPLLVRKIFTSFFFRSK